MPVLEIDTRLPVYSCLSLSLPLDVFVGWGNAPMMKGFNWLCRRSSSSCVLYLLIHEAGRELASLLFFYQKTLKDLLDSARALHEDELHANSSLSLSLLYGTCVHRSIKFWRKYEVLRCLPGRSGKKKKPKIINKKKKRPGEFIFQSLRVKNDSVKLKCPCVFDAISSRHEPQQQYLHPSHAHTHTEKRGKKSLGHEPLSRVIYARSSSLVMVVRSCVLCVCYMLATR